MKKRSDDASHAPDTGAYDVGDLLGLGSHSVRKNYYPELQARIEDLEREKNRYKWLFENALHGIFQGDLKGGFLALNPAMAAICGYAGPEDLRQRVRRLREQLFYTIAEFDGLRQELLDFGRVVARESRLRRVDGRPVDVAITLLRRPDLGAEVVEAFVLDITERVEARKRLEQLNVELEQRVDERTRELKAANEGLRYQITEREKVEQELVVAVDAAKEANRSKDKYLAAASHDLLQPLNAARLLVSSLQDGNLPAQERHLVDRVHRALEGAEDLLADLLDISKLDQQAMKPDMVHVDLGDLVLGLGEEFEPVARDAGLNFRVRHQAVIARTDSRMMTRILRNLLSNALRYTPQGKVLLAMRRRPDRLDLEVWDTGVGIAPDKLEEIFTEFHQLPQAGGGRKGVGLGLAIVDRMARILGCRIQVASRPGQGSRFRLSVPIDAAAQCPQRVATPIGETLPLVSLDGTTVLVIDNEPDILVSMQSLLERWGCRVLVATGTAAAVALCREERRVPGAILADFHLDNDHTGCEAIYAVRRQCRHDVPAAIITADRSDACRRLLQTQYLPVLNKPVKPNRLRALLTSLLTASTAAANPARETSGPG